MLQLFYHVVFPVVISITVVPIVGMSYT